MYITLYLNRSAYLKSVQPVDPDLIAIQLTAIERLNSSNEVDRRIKRLKQNMYLILALKWIDSFNACFFKVLDIACHYLQRME